MPASGKKACFQFPERSLGYAKPMPASGKKACFQFPERSLGYAKICFFFQLRKRRQPKFAKPCPTEAPPGPRIAQPRRGRSRNYVNKIRHAEPAPACLRKRLPPRQLRHRGISRHETGCPARPNGLYDDGKRPILHLKEAATTCRHGFCKHLLRPPRRPASPGRRGRPPSREAPCRPAVRRHIALISRKQLQMTGKNSIFAIH